MAHLGEVMTMSELDDLLLCPVCYDVPSDHIYQCNQGHHVCGPCKARIDVCPVCRSFFFGTRNYAMEELIANLRKLKNTKVTKANASTTPAVTEQSSSSDTPDEQESSESAPSRASLTRERPIAPASCPGLFRCLCCASGKTERFPMARLLNHLRYWHPLDLIEGRLENQKYEQAWRIPIATGRIAIAIRVAEMGIFFLIIDVTKTELYGWMSMAATIFEASNVIYTLTLTANDREATFSDRVLSTRSCEGQMKKRQRCLTLVGSNMRQFLSSRVIGGKVCIRRSTIADTTRAEPRAALRIADRAYNRDDESIDDLLLMPSPPFRAIAVAPPPPGPVDVVPPPHLQRQRFPSPSLGVRQAPRPLVDANQAEQPSDNHPEQLSRSARRRWRRQFREAAMAAILQPQNRNLDNRPNANAINTISANQAAPNANVTSNNSATRAAPNSNATSNNSANRAAPNATSNNSATRAAPNANATSNNSANRSASNAMSNNSVNRAAPNAMSNNSANRAAPNATSNNSATRAAPNANATSNNSANRPASNATSNHFANRASPNATSNNSANRAPPNVIATSNNSANRAAPHTNAHVSYLESQAAECRNRINNILQNILELDQQGSGRPTSVGVQVNSTVAATNRTPAPAGPAQLHVTGHPSTGQRRHEPEGVAQAVPAHPELDVGAANQRNRRRRSRR